MTTIARPRVVSLVPSVTETLRAWGLDPIACTRFCEQPDLTHVGGTKDPDIDAIAALAPDLVVVEREENRRDDYEALVDSGLDVEALHITSVADVAGEIGRLAARVEAEWAPGRLEELADASDRSARFSAFVPIWKRPFMTINAATYGSSMLDAVGVGNVFADHPDTYPTVEAAEILDAAPDLVLAPSEPYPFAERHVPELEAFAPVVLVDGQDLFWWGARTEAALDRLLGVVDGLTGR